MVLKCYVEYSVICCCFWEIIRLFCSKPCVIVMDLCYFSEERKKDMVIVDYDIYT